jgi:N6-adenosine-specific RNA methylase IME4
MNALTLYDKARKALDECRTADEVIYERNRAEALRVFARECQDRTLECDAAEIRMRAERRFGEMILAQKAETGLHKGGRPLELTGPQEVPVLPTPTLAELGVSKNLSSQAQTLATLTPEKFGGLLASWRERVADKRERVTVSLLKEEEQQERRQAHAADKIDGCRVGDLLELVRTGYRAGAMMIDPPWRFMTRSAKGEGRSASNHYRTYGIENILPLPVGELAAENCLIGLWIMDWDENYRMALALLEAWGFQHKTTLFTWVKLNPSGEGYHMGQGYWTRANPETCLLATRGKPKRLNADVRQLIVSPLQEHSQKPDDAYTGMERLVEGPYLELYGRQARQNWTVWGDEIARAEFRAVEYDAPQESPPVGRAKWSQDQIEAIRAYADQQPRPIAAAIAAHFGISRAAIKGICRRHGIALPDGATAAAAGLRRAGRSRG